MRCQYLAVLIRNKLMMAKAEIDSVVVLDAEVDANTSSRMEMILSQSGRTADELEALYGKTMEQIRAELRDQIREQMVVSKMEDDDKDLKVTPSEVRRFFNHIPKDSLPYFSASVEVAEIVRIAKVSAKNQKNDTKTELIAIRNRLLAGENFNELARKFSNDPSVTSNGGDMGWSGRGRMVPE